MNENIDFGQVSFSLLLWDFRADRKQKSEEIRDRSPTIFLPKDLWTLQCATGPVIAHLCTVLQTGYMTCNYGFLSIASKDNLFQFCNFCT